MDTCDVILVDLQDLGCRIYTFITTLRYVLEAASKHRKAVWVLDRPNPVGRPVEGLRCAPDGKASLALGHYRCVTGSRSVSWVCGSSELSSSISSTVSSNCTADARFRAGIGWPLGERAWINPSPNAPNLWMARAYAGTVMLEGTTLSEGRGTTRPLEVFGAPDIDARAVIKEMLTLAPQP